MATATATKRKTKAKASEAEPDKPPETETAPVATGESAADPSVLTQAAPSVEGTGSTTSTPVPDSGSVSTPVGVVPNGKPKAITPENVKKPETFTCTKRQKAELALVSKLGELFPMLTAAEEKYRGSQSIANTHKKAWDSLQEQRDAICTQLAAVAAGGDYQPELFDEADSKESKGKPAKSGTIPEPHPAVHEEGGGKSANEGPVDEGGKLKLQDCLTRKALVKLCGEDCPAEGLTAGKIDEIVSACEGETIAALEAMQRARPNWNRDIKGFGEKWIDRLQDAHAAIRTKFPMPTASPEKPSESTESPAKAGPAGTVLDPKTGVPF